MKQIAVIIASGCLLAGASSAFADGEAAASQKCGCWYIGTGVGYSQVSIDDIPPIAGVTFTQSKDENDTGWKIFGGYNFNPNFAIEGGYVDLGKFNLSANITAPISAAFSADIKFSGPFLDLVGIWPVAENFSLYAKGGGIYASSKTDVSATPALAAAFTAAGIVSDSSDDLKGMAGLGAQFDFNRNFGVRGEWERYFSLGTNGSGKGDVDLFSANLIYTFF